MNGTRRARAPRRPVRQDRRSPSRRCRAALVTVVWGVVALWAPEAASLDLQSTLNQDAERAADPLGVTVVPILGQAAPASSGWTTYLVTIENRTQYEQSGDVYLTPTLGLFREAEVDDAFSQTRLRVAANERVTLELPAFGFAGGSVDAVVISPDGKRLGLGRAHASSANMPHLLVIQRNSRVRQQVKDAALPEVADPAAGSSLPGGLLPPQSPTEVVTSTPEWDLAANQPLLPRRAAGYAPATLVLCPSSVFSELAREQQRALSAWVLTGGTLAFVIDRDADLQDPALVRLVGGNINPSPASMSLRDPVPTRVSSGRNAPTASVQHVTQELSAAAQPLLRGFVSPNLQETRWGSTATYGLGEVTLLGFDPERPEFADDGWTRLKLLDLLGHAWDHRAVAAVPHAATPLRDHRTYSVRRFLLGTRHQHWAIAAAALLLIGYAVLAGPVNFHRARSSARPLLALPRLAALSVACLALVLLVGTLSRGTGRRSRHLSLIDSGAGMPLAAATRFRAFYGSSLDELTIQPTTAGGVLAIVNEDETVRGRLDVTSEGLRLTEVVAKPWQTLHVREDGFATIGEGVSLVLDAGRLDVVNRLGRDLTGVLVRDHEGRLVFFERIADGQRVSTDTGTELTHAVVRSAAGTTGLLAHEHELLVDGTNPGAAQAWTAFEWLRQGEVDWWPAGVPVLMGQLEGGEGIPTDGGFPLEADRAMLRVTGFGGRL